VLHIARVAPPPDLAAVRGANVVLLSHMHHDHFDPASLRMLGPEAKTAIVPRGARSAAAKLGFREVTELSAGESVRVSAINVTATHAAHRGGRFRDRGPAAVGFDIEGTQRAYFAGDTDIFAGMRELGRALDLALLPVGGWGPKLGPGHLDPARAAEALALLEPRVAVPIHWGTLQRIGLRVAHRDTPARAFAREAARVAPSVDVRILAPGEATTVEA
jgi:L-ascorbate metabolism protein UlaG (beta-lactamase superfamily)